MATRRRRELESKIEASGSAKEDSDQPRHTRRTSPRKDHKSKDQEIEDTLSRDDVANEDQDSDGSNNDDQDGDSSFGGMSLDVLAQVATDRLELEPKKKLTKRSIQHMDMLNLEQIMQLSERVLVNMFSDMSADEMKRSYKYICFMMPGKCSEEFSSFGNETRARNQMVSHLKEHISKLTALAKEKGESFEFVAEPVPARKKRILAEKAAEKRRKQKEAQAAARKAKRGIMVSGDFTSMKNRSRTYSGSRTYDVSSKEMGLMNPPPPKRTKTAAQLKKNITRKFNAKAAAAGVRPEEEEIGTSDIDVETTSIKEDDDKSGKSMEQTIQENEQFILDLLSRSQPYHDHCYTTIFGKRKWEVVSLGNEDDIEEDEDGRPSARTGGFKSGAYLPYNTGSDMGKTVLMRVNSAKGVEDPNKLNFPILRVAQLALGMSVDGASVSAEEIVSDGERKVTTQSVASAGFLENGIPEILAGPYPPMPKSELARRGRVPVPEEELTSSDEDGINQSAHTSSAPVNPAPIVRPSRQIRVTSKTDGAAEWERKMALKCIRELRTKKKDEAALICKICKNKTFTATATLMYHYRSHAGIKPFVCLICNTTFTRQHSLNYHMLIHNNQSRFTCKDCGRKFRHPSHFKEHLRRHTGETPFHCTDCPLRFKTRNTYKRHLKTRHGKLLTAHGIRVMPHEEFLKVRTKQYKRGSFDGEGDDYEDDEEESEEDDESVDNEQDDDQNVLTESGGHTIPAEGAQQLVDDVHSASNKLLQFCSQVVNSETC